MQNRRMLNSAAAKTRGRRQARRTSRAWRASLLRTPRLCDRTDSIERIEDLRIGAEREEKAAEQ